MQSQRCALSRSAGVLQLDIRLRSSLLESSCLISATMCQGCMVNNHPPPGDLLHRHACAAEGARHREG